jgi:major membrane immunogen (membrane-anchored lipoprotein)
MAPAGLGAGALLAALIAGCAGPSVDTDKPLADGSYEGVSGEDEDGATGLVTVEISDGKVVACDFEVIQKDGSPKDEDYGKDSSGEVANDAYYAKAQAAVQAFDEYAAELVEVGYPQDVDVISGATWAYEQFVEGAVKAMREAQAAWSEDGQ